MDDIDSRRPHGLVVILPLDDGTIVVASTYGSKATRGLVFQVGVDLGGVDIGPSIGMEAAASMLAALPRNEITIGPDVAGSA